MSRIKKFTKILQKNNLDAFIVTNQTNIFYLTGFKGVSPQEREAILIFNLYPSKLCLPVEALAKGGWSGATLITARLYQNEAHKVAAKSLKVKIVRERNEIFQLAQKLISPFSQSQLGTHRQAGLDDEYRIGFEENDLKYSEYQKLKTVILTLSKTKWKNQKPQDDKSKKRKLNPTKDLIENLRSIKSDEEIEKIEKAQIISQKAFSKLLKTIKVGQTEEEIAENLNKIMKSLGAQGLAFETIAASGPNSGKPHHVTCNRRLAKNDILLLDFGAKYQNYCADISRTIFIGKAQDREKNIYNLVQKAQTTAIKKAKSGIKTSTVFDSAHQVLQKTGNDRYFLHGLGHGVGLEIHEKPYLRPTRTQARLVPSRQAGLEDEELKENMVFSVEPGLYFGWGGIRIEDLVTIKNGKAKVLGEPQTKLIEIS